jgi:TPR repeat protein
MATLAENRIGTGTTSSLLEPPRDPCPRNHPPGERGCRPRPGEECWYASQVEYRCRPRRPQAACEANEQRTAGVCCPADTTWVARERHCRPVAMLARCDGGALDACVGAGEAMAFSASSRTRDGVRARLLLGRACEGGDGRGCERLAFLWRQGIGGPTDVARASALNREGCRARRESACVSYVQADDEGVVARHRAECAARDSLACVGVGYDLAWGNRTPRDAGAGRRQLAASCDGTELLACAFLAASLAQEPRPDAATSRRIEALHLRACDGGALTGCTNLGVMYSDGRGVTQNAARAVELLRRACDGGDMFGCTNLGVIYSDGRGVAQDAARAVELYRQACDGGDMNGCANLGVACESGRGVTQDAPHAVELYRRACDGGHMRGCVNLGVMYLNGRGVTHDPARAVELSRRACDGGHMRGCVNLGVMYSNGRGVTHDPARAVELYRRACDGGHMPGCVNLGATYANGRGVTQDARRAVELFRRACDGGDMFGCTNLGAHCEVGNGVTRDIRRARDLYTRACDGGVPEACGYLAALQTLYPP